MLILVLGKNLLTAKFADFLSLNKNNIVFTTAKSNLANNIEIPISNFDEIKDFIIANEVSLLISADKYYMDIDWTDFLKDTECCVFSPDEFISKLCLNSSFSKKFVYKNKLLTSRFLVHEKLQTFLDYIKVANFPICIMPDNINETQPVYIAETKNKAEIKGEELFLTGNKKILTEEYIEGNTYTRYYLTDGIDRLFCLDTISYFDEISTNNTSYIADEVKNKIENEYIPIIFNDFMEEEVEFSGILGISFTIDKNNNVYLLNFKPFFDELDFSIFLNTVDEDVADLFYSCANKTFFKNKNEIKFTDKYAISCDISGKISTFCSNTMNQAVKIADYNGACKNLFEAIKHWKR